MIGGSKETPRSAWMRGLIDAVYGSPRPWGFCGFALAVGAIVLMLASLLIMPAQTGPDEPAPPTPLGAICLVVVLVVASVALVASQWLIRRYYRTMYGSAYDRS